MTPTWEFYLIQDVVKWTRRNSHHTLSLFISRYLFLSIFFSVCLSLSPSLFVSLCVCVSLSLSLNFSLSLTSVCRMARSGVLLSWKTKRCVLTISISLINVTVNMQICLTMTHHLCILNGTLEMSTV